MSRRRLREDGRQRFYATASTSATAWVLACWWCRCAPPISRASPPMAPWDVAATGSSPCLDASLPVRASLRRGRVLVWLRVVWRRPARLRIFVGARLPPPRASPGAAPRGVAAADTSVQARTLLRASPRRGRVRNGSALSGGGRRLPVRAYHHRGRVRKAPHGVPAAGYHLSRGWVFEGFGNGSGRKLSSNFLSQGRDSPS